MSESPYVAVLWDMDGTLVDTERFWMAAEEELVESFGGRWTHEDALGQALCFRRTGHAIRARARA